MDFKLSKNILTPCLHAWSIFQIKFTSTEYFDVDLEIPEINILILAFFA